MHFNRILIHYAEIALKGRNRGDFERRLQSNIRHRLHREGLPWAVHRGPDRLIVEVPEGARNDVARAVDIVREVPGTATVAAARYVSPAGLRRGGSAPDIEWLAERACRLIAPRHRADAAFAVRVNRGDKGFPLDSEALASRLGRAIIEQTDWQRVDLRDPDTSLHVDIYPEAIFLYLDRHPGPGGLPVGSGGRVLSLLSGGIDSPVAAWMMCRRGCPVDFLHLTAGHPPTRDPDENLAVRLAARLSRYTLRSRLVLLPFTHFDLALADRRRTGFEMVLFRRFLNRLGERVAARLGAQALVSGDSLGQVASQTLGNLVAAGRAVNMPVLQPLVGLDKHRIVEEARAIGTFELSTEPYKDCCALISRQPRTHARHEGLESLERERLQDYAALIRRTLDDAVVVQLESGGIGEITGLHEPFDASDPDQAEARHP